MIEKILTFCPLPPTITGGIEEYAYSVIEELRDKGYNVIVATSKFNDNIKYPDPKEGYIYVPSFSILKRPIPKNPASFLKLASAIRSSDIIHIHMPYPFIESFSALVSKLFHKKVVVTYHMDARIDDSFSSKKWVPFFSIIEKAYVWLSARWACSLCDVICTNTMGYALTSNVLKKYLSKIKVIHQGIRKELYNQLDYSKARELRSQYLNGRYSHMVTFVGRLVPYKGLHYLIEAVNILKVAHPNIIFVIGGNGPEKDKMMNMVNSYHLTNVKFIGFVPDDTLFSLFAASDLVVSPSISNLESTPISLLCALSSGTPVIGTEVGGTAETIPNDGVLGSIIPARDSNILAETIVKMLDKKRTERIDKHLPRFWSEVTDDYLNLMMHMTSQRLASIKKGLIGI